MTEYFDDYFFTSNVTKFVCPAWEFGGYTWLCQHPNACATDPSTTKQYCCNAGPVSPICWAPFSVCASDDSTFTCNSGSSSWCCLKNKETCTQLAGQINICYSLAHDTLNNISSNVLDGTYSSLNSAQPSASSYTFDPILLIAQTQTISTQTTSTQTTPTQTTSTQTTSIKKTSSQTGTATISPSPSKNTPSGGEIAGIAIGVVAAIAVICFAAFLFVRHRQRKHNGLAQAAVYQSDSHDKGDSKQMPQEMRADTTRATELPGNWQHYPPQELPAAVPPSQSQGYPQTYGVRHR